MLVRENNAANTTSYISGSPVYFLTYRYLHGLAFFFATFLIDTEPVLYMIFGVPQPRVPLLFGGYMLIGLT